MKLREKQNRQQSDAKKAWEDQEAYDKLYLKDLCYGSCHVAECLFIYLFFSIPFGIWQLNFINNC